MKVSEVVKAWRDPMFRSTRSNVPADPAGLVELSGTALDAVAGGTFTTPTCGSSKGSHGSKKRKGSKKCKSSKRRKSSKKH